MTNESTINTGIVVDRRNFLKLSGYGLFSMACCSPASHAALWGSAGRGSYKDKMLAFNRDHSGDIFLVGRDQQIFENAYKRLRRVQAMVGYGNFNLLGFNGMVRTAKQYASIGEFTRQEVEFIEKLFYQDASILGFFGEKVITELDTTIPRSQVSKIPNSGGHYLKIGESLETFHRAQRAVGNDVVLTSGVRGVAKQIYLFLNKIRRTKGNMSRASRSVAPPGYSFHGAGDFDIGQRGLGTDNFTAAFSHTDIHTRLIDQGVMEQRYPPNNPYGVRYEPWHIKISS